MSSHRIVHTLLQWQHLKLNLSEHS